MATVAEDQILKSRHRVKAYGEVLTPRHMVDRMLELVGTDLESGVDFVDKTFFEPAAGDGNFLVAILQRKLLAIEARHPRAAWPRETLHALASIYAVELLEDNHCAAKANMLREFLDFHEARQTPCGPETDLHRAAIYLIDANIVRGNTLSATTASGDDVLFSWWNRIAADPGMVQREPFTLASLRTDGFDFTDYAVYKPCRIDRVHEEVKADG